MRKTTPISGWRLRLYMDKRLAVISEQRNHDYVQIMRQINEVAVHGGLRQFDTYSRLWEYPWVWTRLEPLKGRNLRVLDIGSELSPFSWFLATQGFDVTVSDVKANCWQFWQKASQALGVKVHKRILNAQNLDIPTSSLDIYLSLSVIEHVPDKTRAICEAARVLRPEGLLVMTFDICEPDMGMTFPEWNGRALSMHEFDSLFRDSSWFESGLTELAWNTGDIPDYLAWNRTTAPWHNYVAGAAVARRNNKTWVESIWKDSVRTLRKELRTFYFVGGWYLRCGLSAAGRKIVQPIKSSI